MNTHRPLIEITHQAIHILSRELGVVDTIRFLSQFNTGQGDYTQERETLFAELNLDTIISEIKQMRNNIQ
jgi:hypothetical protein